MFVTVYTNFDGTRSHRDLTVSTFHVAAGITDKHYYVQLHGILAAFPVAVIRHSDKNNVRGKVNSGS